jgi:hypothetical protein
VARVAADPHALDFARWAVDAACVEGSAGAMDAEAGADGVLSEWVIGE